MRIRSIRPEFWTSEDIVSLTWEQRLIYIGLWSYVDDNGVGRDNPKLIAADLFPLEDNPQVVLKRVHGALTEFSSKEMISRYTVDGKPYLHISAWSEHQKINRPSEGRYPLPTRADASFSEPSVSTPANAPLGEGEKGRRGEGDVHGKPRTEPSRFAEFWAVYPNKKGKIPAEANWDRLMKKGVDPQAVINGAKAYADSVRGVDKSKVKMPQGWLTDGRWEDELDYATRPNDGRPEGW